MDAREPIRMTLGMSDNILTKYLSDLDDADLTVHPVEGMNHIAWQVGHLISSEHKFLEAIRPGASPALPEGFQEAHPWEHRYDGPKNYRTRDEYLKLWKGQREATLRVLGELDDAALDAPAPEAFQRMCPNVGSAFNLMGAHTLMHVGQFVAVRRKAGKPIAI